MAFIRLKKLRGREYAYLVESRWDTTRGSSRQVVMKYLGPADRVRIDDVPPKHRTDTVKRFLVRRSASAAGERRRLANGFVTRFERALVQGNRKAAEQVAEETEKALGLDAMYVDVLTEAMHRVGERWGRGEISISVEHLATNLARDIVERTNSALRLPDRTRGVVALCTPPGEEHDLATKMLEGLLRLRGYRTMNIAASAPFDSVVGFLESRKPDYVFVSLTVPAHLPAAKRLVHGIRERVPGARILVGGQGLEDAPANAFPSETTLGDGTLGVIDSLQS